MPTIIQFMESDHHLCDGYLADAETAVEHRDWPMAITSFKEFESGLRRHLAMEENALFPAFEQIPGAPAGPTNMMRTEHRQMLELVTGMRQAILEQDPEEFVANADVLHIMMGQHNMKEESILYPMADRFLDDKVQAVIEAMRELQEADPSDLAHDIPQSSGVK